MIIDNIISLLEERERIATETQDNWYDGIEHCNQELVNLFASNISDGITFLNETCSASQFVWLSEIIEDIIEISHSKAFLDAYKTLSIKYAEETSRYNIKSFIDDAESNL